MPVFDTSTLLYFMDPDAKVPDDPTTNKPIKNPKQRVDLLIESLISRNQAIVVPAPVFGELLVKSGNHKERYLDILYNNEFFHIVPFDQRAAIIFADLMNEEFKSSRSPPREFHINVESS